MRGDFTPGVERRGGIHEGTHVTHVGKCRANVETDAWTSLIGARNTLRQESERLPGKEVTPDCQGPDLPG